MIHYVLLFLFLITSDSFAQQDNEAVLGPVPLVEPRNTLLVRAATCALLAEVVIRSACIEDMRAALLSVLTAAENETARAELAEIIRLHSNEALLPAPPNRTPNIWFPSTQEDPITGRVSYFLSQSSQHPSTAAGSRQPMLTLRCRSSTTLDLLISWGGTTLNFMRDFDSVEVRVGRTIGGPETWNLSTDRQATFSRDPQALISRMMAAEALVARISPQNSGMVTAEFDLRNFAEASASLRNACPSPRAIPRPRPSAPR